MSEGTEPVPVDRLQQLVVSRLVELDLSARRAAELSEPAISYETVRAMVRGNHSGRISDKVARGLSKALQVPVERIYEAASAPKPQSKWELPERMDRMPLPERRKFEDLMGSFLDMYEQGMRDARAS